MNFYLNFIKFFTFYFFSGIIGSSIFILLLWSNVFDSSDVLLIRCQFLLLLTCIISTIVIILLKLNKKFSFITYRDIVIVSILLFSGNYYLYANIAFNVSRSNSMIMVKYMYDNRQERLSEHTITEYVKKEYFDEYKAINLRLQEQIKMGYVKEINNNYYLTEKGINIVEVLAYLSTFYNLDNNFLLKEYK